MKRRARRSETQFAFDVSVAHAKRMRVSPGFVRSRTDSAARLHFCSDLPRHIVQRAEETLRAAVLPFSRMTIIQRLTILCVFLVIPFVSFSADAKGNHSSGRTSAPKSSAAPRKSAAPKSTAPVHVSSYVKPTSGTTVAAHARTAPNQTQKDNWSAKPNVNPTTGKPGTKTPTK